jgi:single-strand DNA-binding protein
MFNQMTIVGRAGADAEMRYTQTGTAVASFNVATDVGWGENKSTQWFKVTLWGKLAENVSQYVTKGKQIFVQGELTASEWTTNEGQQRTTLEVNAATIKLLGSGQASPTDLSQERTEPAVISGTPIETDGDNVEDLPW